METLYPTTQSMEYRVNLPDNLPPDALVRWQKAITEMVSGYEDNPELDVVFDIPFQSIVISKGIDFSSLCEHHLFPFFGTVDVAYIPREKVVGLSKLARTVDCFSRRFQTQEQMTQQIADAIDVALDPIAVGVITRATHTCQKCRGIKRSGEMIASTLRGAFFTDVSARTELMQLLAL